MDDQRSIVAPRQLRRLTQGLRAHGVGGVRCDRRRDSWVVGPVLEKGLGIRQRIVRGRRIGRRVVENGLAENAPQPGIVHHPCDVILEVVHIGERRGPGANHLEYREAGPDADELGVHQLRLGREDVVL